MESILIRNLVFLNLIMTQSWICQHTMSPWTKYLNYWKHSKAENAIELARNYWDRCGDLKVEIITMKALKL